MCVSTKKQNMATKTTTPRKKAGTDNSYFGRIKPKAISQTRNDIAVWKAARMQAQNINNPRRARLQNLYNDVMMDALLASQIENRRMQTLQSSFSLSDASGKLNEEATAIIKASTWFPVLVSAIVDSNFYGPTLAELIPDMESLKIAVIPRNNIVPETGMLYWDETDSNGLPYREAKEYGTWLLEFGQPGNFGLINKAIPHVLFKRFAQSCWSELCEIYGIPPRVMKTNTQDPAMLTRAEQMMRDMGAAAWFIIDETEAFEFAKGADTNGDVYNNLINLCNNEMSLLISGAVIGQDTKNGNESKETISVEMLENLVNADKRMVEGYMNTLVLPALSQIGILKGELLFSFDPEEDVRLLWTMTKEVLPFMEVDPEWIKIKFGIEVTGTKTQASSPPSEGAGGGSNKNFQ